MMVLVLASRLIIRALSCDRILPVPVFQINNEKSDRQPKPCFSWIGYTIDIYSGSFARPIAELKVFFCFSELVDICVALEQYRFVHVKRIASIVGQIVSLSPSCGTVSQILTRYLHFIVHSRHSWNSSVFVHDQDKNELLFSRDGCSAFIQGTDLAFQKNWSLDKSDNSSTWRELAAIKFSIEAFGTRLSKQRVRIRCILMVGMRFR